MNKDFTVLTTNFARINQGLRLLEDVVRFVFADQELFQALKSLRKSLSQTQAWFGSAHLIRGRSGLPAISQTKDQDHPSFGLSLYSMIHAEAGKVCEGLSILEQFSSVYAPTHAFVFQKARYQIFSLERDLLIRTPHFYLLQYCEQGMVYPISDSVEELKDCVESGARMIQLSDTKSNKELVLKKTKELCRFLQKKYTEGKEKVVFLVHEYVDIAVQAPVDGIHIYKNTTPVSQVRYQLGSNKIISKRVSSVNDAQHLLFSGVDMLSFGSLFDGYQKNHRIFQEMEQFFQQMSVSASAFGGITPDNIEQVWSTGCKNVGVTESINNFFPKRG